MQEKITCHSPRAMAYLWGIGLDGAQLSLLKWNYRHKTIEQAQKYANDAQSKKNRIVRSERLQSLNLVPPFRDRLLVFDGGSQSQRLNAMDGCKTDLVRTVKEVAKYYVERNLGVTPGKNSNYRNPGYLLRKAYSLASTALVPSDSVFTIIERLPSPLKEEMDNAVSTMLATLEHYYWMKHSQEINRHAATPKNPLHPHYPITKSILHRAVC
jgi:hypothetical protein